MPQPRIRPLGEPPPQPSPAGGGGGSRPVRLFGREVAASVHQRVALATGRRLVGPAIVDQMDTTTWIPPGWQGWVVPSGALVLERT